jgi:zinc transport system substrate-binding protein
MMSIIDPLEEELVAGMQTVESDSVAALDEHVWTSPRDAVSIVGAITRALGDAEPYYRDFFLEKRDDYIYQLDNLDRAFGDVIFPAPLRTVVFGDRFPFRYLFEHYRLHYAAAFPGCAAESEASAATLAFLIDKVKAEHIPVVFYTELSTRKIANTIADATGAVTAEFHSGHNVTKADFDAGVTYVELQYRNIDALRIALYPVID